MHTPVENVEIRDKADQSGAASREGIEYANLDIDMVVQAQEAGIDRLGQGIIHEQPHPHAAICGLDKS